jgi:hypothetical protein
MECVREAAVKKFDLVSLDIDSFFSGWKTRNSPQEPRKEMKLIAIKKFKKKILFLSVRFREYFMHPLKIFQSEDYEGNVTQN